jgi:hypothetical protein
MGSYMAGVVTAILKANPGHETEVHVMTMTIAFVIGFLAILFRKQKSKGLGLFTRQPTVSDAAGEKLNVAIGLISLVFGVVLLVSFLI